MKIVISKGTKHMRYDTEEGRLIIENRSITEAEYGAALAKAELKGIDVFDAVKDCTLYLPAYSVETPSFDCVVVRAFFLRDRKVLVTDNKKLAEVKICRKHITAFTTREEAEEFFKDINAPVAYGIKSLLWKKDLTDKDRENFCKRIICPALESLESALSI